MTADFFPPEIIRHKRDGTELSREQIEFLIDGYVRGTVTDYQMSAWAMAVFFRGMTPAETQALTFAMRDSGTVIDLASVPGLKVDKHSTGGVGDKVSLCLAPWVAACGVPVPMVCGRGLGHTGGTVDKLESIRGFRTDLSIAEFRAQVRSIGCAMIGQTEDLAPADKKLYALRDVTATVESVPLITASILSKKLAEGIDALVMDVKVGAGAFMKTLADARTLAKSIVRVAQLGGVRVTALLTDMNAPIGYAVGNALEVREACWALHPSGSGSPTPPRDLMQNTWALAREMLVLGGVASSTKQADALLRDALESGRALHKMQALVEAQGGDPDVVTDPSRLGVAPHTQTITVHQTGFVTAIDAYEIGMCATLLGAGRTRKEDTIDPGAGIVLAVQRGDKVARDTTLATLYSSDPTRLQRVAPRVRAAFRIGKRAPAARPLVLDTIRPPRR
jgi:pyrimidine-nucleoside phosphorylase